jgi:hypothetical protein
MAYVAGRWWTELTFQESSGKTTTRRYEQDNPVDYAAALVSTQALVTDMQACTDCNIIRHRTYQDYDTDVTSLPTNAEKEIEAVLTFKLAGYLTKSATLTVPGAKIGMFEATTGEGRDNVNTSETIVTNLAANWLLDELFLISDGEQAELLSGGHRRTKGNART